jgi:hypothetical protein
MDVTPVRKYLLGAPSAMLLATAGIAITTAPSHAEQTLHNVRYTLTAAQPIYADIHYLDQEPPNFADWSHNPYQFVPNIQGDVGPNQRWVYELTLVDPNQWAFFTGSTGPEPDTPMFHCELAVDGVVVVSKDGPKGVICSIRSW